MVVILGPDSRNISIMYPRQVYEYIVIGKHTVFVILSFTYLSSRKKSTRKFEGV